MNSFYFVLGFVLGVLSMLGAVWIIISGIPQESPSKIEEEIDDEPKAQFIDPEPLSEKLKDGLPLNEIID